MAKQTGLGDNLYVAGFDLSGDTGNLGRIGGGNSPLDVTGIDKSGYERLGGKRDGAIEWSAWYNATGAHPVLSALPTADRIVTYCRGTTLGDPAAAVVGKQINYDGTRGEDGSYALAVQALADGFGLEWGRQLTAGKRTDGAPANGGGVDNGVSSAFGLQAYLHVFAFAGTSVTIKIQDSNDNGGTDPFADVVGGTFSAASGVTSERIATAGGLTVKRWLRVVTTGTFSNAVFAVAVMRNDVAVSF